MTPPPCVACDTRLSSGELSCSNCGTQALVSLRGVTLVVVAGDLVREACSVAPRDRVVESES